MKKLKIAFSLAVIGFALSAVLASNIHSNGGGGGNGDTVPTEDLDIDHEDEVEWARHIYLEGVTEEEAAALAGFSSEDVDIEDEKSGRITDIVSEVRDDVDHGAQGYDREGCYGFTVYVPEGYGEGIEGSGECPAGEADRTGTGEEETVENGEEDAEDVEPVEGTLEYILQDLNLPGTVHEFEPEMFCDGPGSECKEQVIKPNCEGGTVCREHLLGGLDGIQTDNPPEWTSYCNAYYGLSFDDRVDCIEPCYGEDGFGLSENEEGEEELTGDLTPMDNTVKCTDLVESFCSTPHLDYHPPELDGEAVDEAAPNSCTITGEGEIVE